ncbi:hypothetical protein KIN20_026711 [Parelaphostrongylus tenuis]|uniref:Uncharacterized protein n=1 Tax=Parelaphostrongylus tenuis TaxID=148309 RepID=A0AAD5QYE4_PARTN|nr:hypothetical protein KIN20_026711 [Parelaphostrongylus tenuis]
MFLLHYYCTDEHILGCLIILYKKTNIYSRLQGHWPLAATLFNQSLKQIGGNGEHNPLPYKVSCWRDVKTAPFSAGGQLGRLRRKNADACSKVANTDHGDEQYSKGHGRLSSGTQVLAS